MHGTCIKITDYQIWSPTENGIHIEDVSVQRAQESSLIQQR
jgi:hypothetical protein